MADRVTETEINEQNFESVYRRLEEAVEQLESGGLSLEESINLYETGMRLAHLCRAMLDDAELRVTKLEQEYSLETLEDDVDEEPF